MINPKGKMCNGAVVSAHLYLDGGMSSSILSQYETHIRMCSRCARTLRSQSSFNRLVINTLLSREIEARSAEFKTKVLLSCNDEVG